jgi:type 1 fimbria pilin
MKKTLTLLGSAFLLAGATCAFAASSTSLTVTGIITPVACTPSLSKGGLVNNGKISAGDLNPTRSTLVGKHPLQLTVACDAPARFALDPIDNRAGTGIVSGMFGLGLTDDGEKLGYVQVAVKNALADGQPAQAIDSDDGGATWNRTPVTSPGYLLSVGSATDSSVPIAVEDLTMDFEVWTLIAPADSLTLTDEVVMDGSATFEMKYL